MSVDRRLSTWIYMVFRSTNTHKSPGKTAGVPLCFINSSKDLKQQWKRDAGQWIGSMDSLDPCVVILVCRVHKHLQASKIKEIINWWRILGRVQPVHRNCWNPRSVSLIYPWPLCICSGFDTELGLRLRNPLAVILHAKRSEGQGTFMNFILLVLAAFVAYFRYDEGSCSEYSATAFLGFLFSDDGGGGHKDMEWSEFFVTK